MLANYYKTPADLQLTDAELWALVKVLGMLERGELVHLEDFAAIKPNGFNMAYFKAQTECNTVACIAGWADLVGKSEFCRARLSWPPALEDLFTASGVKISHHKITTTQAAVALRNYLTTGQSNWAEALEE